MRTNVEILKELGILGNIRERVFDDWGDHEEDDSKDDIINKMTPYEIITEWCGWELGDSSWWKKMKNMFDILTKEASKQ